MPSTISNHCFDLLTLIQYCCYLHWVPAIKAITKLVVAAFRFAELPEIAINDGIAKVPHGTIAIARSTALSTGAHFS